VKSLVVACGRFFFRTRNAVFPLVLILLVAFDRPRLAFGSWTGKAWLDAAGVFVALAGQALRALTIGLAYIRRGGLDGKVYADRLVQEGLFAHCRNPLYVGNFLGLVGYILVFHGRLLYAVGLPFFAFAYLAIVLNEEQFLRDKFGAEFDSYRRRVPRFVPRLRGLGATLEGARFDWARVIRKEYGTTMTGATLLLALLVWTRWQLGGRELALSWLRVAVPIELLFVVAYLFARRFKKSGRLGQGSRETAPAS
jgi:protein-S-isoprenylcysteine O-methyltransferase Ste14